MNYIEKKSFFKMVVLTFTFPSITVGLFSSSALLKSSFKFFSTDPLQFSVLMKSNTATKMQACFMIRLIVTVTEILCCFNELTD